MNESEIMKKTTITVLLLIAGICVFTHKTQAAGLSNRVESKIALKFPGNVASVYELKNQNGVLSADKALPLEIRQKSEENDSVLKIEVVIKAQELTYYSFEQTFSTQSIHSDCQFYMPGFWYHKNLRSPKEAPSFHTSDSWQVREDRLSTPLTGIFNDKNGEYYTVLRTDKIEREALGCHNHGEVILSGKTDLGFTGFRNVNGISTLVFGFPYSEAPKTYIRKLTLAPAIQTFEKLNKGESRTITWEIKKGKASDYSAFVAQQWNYSFDKMQPKPVSGQRSAEETKELLAVFYKDSYVDNHALKYFSGVELRTDDCESTGVAEIGFVGRVLLNAYNALEYGEANNRQDLVDISNAIFDSYLEHGFTPNGLFRELVDFDKNEELNVYSIRRQSEGVYAVLNYLKYEKTKKRSHPQWEAKMKRLLDNFMKIQNEDGSFPRKFDDNLSIADASGGSTPSATLPLVMAYSYFKNKTYLNSAKKTAGYLEKELISKADYFSSTLDANCEDKEASLYASTAMYYLALVSKGEERRKYADLCLKSAYFCLSWYYTWDVPFAQGQMLGDLGFLSRGWGNVSVENNHVDVFIFEFATILEWLSKEYNEPRFSAFSSVIKTSMLQLMPVPERMCGIGKVGYYPEVVQHTNWDYGKNGKGFYNDIFAPGWTVASLWQMLSPQRVEDFFNSKK
jgi:Highly conserved protein containing a thioredoxin domain